MQILEKHSLLMISYEHALLVSGVVGTIKRPFFTQMAILQIRVFILEDAFSRLDEELRSQCSHYRLQESFWCF